jgi:hypothetical protein
MHNGFSRHLRRLAHSLLLIGSLLSESHSLPPHTSDVLLELGPPYK